LISKNEIKLSYCKGKISTFGEVLKHKNIRVEQMDISEILNSEKNKVKAWYPSSGLDFRDLLVLGQNRFIYDKNVFADELLEFDVLPDLFIHTDKAYNIDNWPLASKGIIFEDDESVYTILLTKDVKAGSDRVVGKLLNLKIKSELLKEDTNQQVLFLFTDNISFFKNYVLKEKLSVDFLINIRDGFSENGGADYSMRLLEFYLGLMNTKYLISDNFGRSPMDISIFENDVVMMQAFRSEENAHTVLQGLKEWSWSEFGIFGGDALLIMVHKFL
jgi:hypothetical protein